MKKVLLSVVALMIVWTAGLYPGGVPHPPSPTNSTASESYAGGLIGFIPSAYPLQSTAENYTSHSSGLPTEGIWRADIDVGDIDNDGWIDIIHTGPRKSNSYATGLYAWENLNGTRWRLHTNLSARLRDGGAVLGDIDGDGRLDAAFGCHGTANLQAFKGHGNFTFTKWSPDPPALPNLTASGGYIDVDLGDIDNDGDLDLAAATFWGGGIGVWRWDGNGSWNLTNSSRGLPDGSNEHTYAVLFDDVNSDGNLDLVTSFGNGCCFGFNNWGRWVFLGDGNGTWRNSSRGMQVLSDSDGLDVDTADFNNDGKRDLVVISTAGLYYVNVFLGDGTGNWTRTRLIQGYAGYPQVLEAADMNNDGNDDIVLMTYTRSSSNDIPHLYIYYGRGDGRNFTQTNVTINARGKPYGLDVADVDHNGYLDIIASTGQDKTSYPGGVYVWKNTRTVPSTPSVRVLYPRGGETFTVGGIRTIEWTSAGSARPFSVKLEYSITGPSGPFFTIATNLPDTGKYQWRVPNTPSTNCYVRVTVQDSSLRTASAVSRGAFRIIDKEGRSQRLTLFYPNGSEIFFTGQRCSIYVYSLLNATPSKPVDVKIYFSYRGLSGPYGNVGTLIMKRKGLHVYNWTIPSYLPFSNSSFFLISAVDPNLNVTLNDTNDAPFYILTPNEHLSTVEIICSNNTTVVGGNITLRAIARNVNGGMINHLVRFVWSWPEELGDAGYGIFGSENFTFNATARGRGNISVTAIFLSFRVNASINITVLEKLSWLIIDPWLVSGRVGERYVVTAKALNPLGRDISELVNLTWTAHGNISLKRTLSAGVEVLLIAPGTGKVKVTAKLREDTLENSTLFSINPYFSHISVEPPSVYIRHRESVRLLAYLYNSSDFDVTSAHTIYWAVTGGVGTLHASNGTENIFTATRPGRGDIVVYSLYYGENVSTIVPVLVRPVLDRVVVNPKNITLFRGEVVSIAVTAYDSTGRALGTEANYTWDVGGGVGGLSWGSSPMNKVFSAENVGEGVITVTVEWWGDVIRTTIPVKVLYNLTRVELSPQNVTLEVGDFIILSAAAYTDTDYNIIAQCNVSWEILWEGEAGVELEQQSCCRVKVTALHWGEGNVVARITYKGRDMVARSHILIPAPLTHLELKAQKKTLFIGETTRLFARALAADGSDITSKVVFVWNLKEGPGELNSSEDSALLTGTDEGVAVVAVSATYYSITLRNSTEISVARRPKLGGASIEVEKIVLKPGENTTLIVNVLDEEGQPFLLPFNASWSSDGGTFNSSTGRVVIFTPTTTGYVKVVVRITSEFGTSSANTTLYVKPPGEAGGEKVGKAGGEIPWALVAGAVLSLTVAIILLLYFYKERGRGRGPHALERSPRGKNPTSPPVPKEVTAYGIEQDNIQPAREGSTPPDYNTSAP